MGTGSLKFWTKHPVRDKFKEINSFFVGAGINSFLSELKVNGVLEINSATLKQLQRDMLRL